MIIQDLCKKCEEKHFCDNIMDDLNCKRFVEVDCVTIGATFHNIKNFNKDQLFNKLNESFMLFVMDRCDSNQSIIIENIKLKNDMVVENAISSYLKYYTKKINSDREQIKIITNNDLILKEEIDRYLNI